MKFCSKCGNKLNDNDIFCVYCGAKVENNNQETETKAEETFTETVEATPIFEEPKYYECKLCGSKVDASLTNCPVCGSLIEKGNMNVYKPTGSKSSRKTNTFGLIAFIAAIFGDFISMTAPILGIISGILAIVFGIIGIIQIKKGKGKGIAFAIIGLAVGAIDLLLASVWLLIGDEIMAMYEDIFEEFLGEMDIFKFFK